MQNKNPWYIETAELAEMLFPEAGELWLASRTPYISPKTFHEFYIQPDGSGQLMPSLIGSALGHFPCDPTISHT